MKSVKILSVSNPFLKINAGLCNTFYTRLMGFMFKSQPDPYYGLFFPGKADTKVDSAIHMFFVNFDLAVFWLNENNTVVDKVLAKKWHPFYVPRKSARHILELHENRIDDLLIGDQVEITYVE